MTRILVQEKEGHHASPKEEPSDEPRHQEDTLMKYALLLYGNASQAPHYTPEEARAARQAWFDLLEEMKAAQVYLFNYGLAPETAATTVRVRDFETVTTAGPVAETPEQLGGYFMLDCKDLEEAIGWAAKIPYAQGGSIEVRPAIAYT
jgi:hypothetical protein